MSINFKNKNVKILLGICGVILLVVFMLIIPGTKSEQPTMEIIRPVKTMDLKHEHKKDTRSLPGIVQADKEVDLSFRVGGPLQAISVEVGQYVNKDDIIAQIDPRDYHIRLMKLEAAVKEAESRLGAMKKGARKEDIDSLEANYKALQARYAEAQLNFKRHQTLYEQYAVSKAVFDKVKVALDMTSAQLEAARQELKKAKLGARIEEITAMEASIDGLHADLTAAKNAIHDTMLKAPFSGYIYEKKADIHETVMPGQPIVSLLDMSRLNVHTSVPEDMIIHKDDFLSFTCEFEAFPEHQFEAALKFIGKKTAKANQSYPLTVTLQPPECCVITPGMAATVNFQIQKNNLTKDSFFIPIQSLFADEYGNNNVWVLDKKSMTVHKTPVSTGLMTRDTVQVVSGLSGDMEIITAGAKFLMEGQKVRKMNQKAENI